MRDLQDLIVEKTTTDEAFRERVGETLQLHDLQDHPGWKALYEHFRNGKEGYGRELAQSMMRGEPVDQRSVDYMRGAKEMAEAIFAYPKIALDNLERTARALLAGEFEREVAQQAVASPYIDGPQEVS